MDQEQVHERVMELFRSQKLYGNEWFDRTHHLYITMQQFSNDFSEEKQNICAFVTQTKQFCGCLDDDPTIMYTARRMEAPVDILSQQYISLDDLALSIATHSKQDLEDAWERMNDRHPCKNQIFEILQRTDISWE